MTQTTGTIYQNKPLNITGDLFSKTKSYLPIFNSIGAVPTPSQQYIMGASFSRRAPHIPTISEATSVTTVPDPTYYDRTNNKNTVMLFEEAVKISYLRSSDNATLSTDQLALVGNTNNVGAELPWQVTQKMEDIRNDMEYTIINGVYNEPTSESVAAQTDGLIHGIGTTAIAAGGDELNGNLLEQFAYNLHMNSPFTVDSMTIFANPEQLKQLQKIVKAEGEKISPTVAGTNIYQYITEFGNLNFYVGGHPYVPNGTLLAVNLGMLSNRYLEVPGKGGFFYEPKPQDGAALGGIIYGQWGLDYGNEWFHGKITGLATSTVPAKPGISVFVGNTVSDPIPTNETGSALAKMFNFSVSGVAATIDEAAKTIAVTVPHGTVVTALKASFDVSDNATVKVGSTAQVSGVTANDFTSPVTYVVTAENGTTTASYVVTVTVAEA